MRACVPNCWVGRGGPQRPQLELAGALVSEPCGCGYTVLGRGLNYSKARMDEDMPWRDTPANRVRWRRLQNSYAFLNQQALSGTLQCSYCGLSPLIILHWSDHSGQGLPRKATVDHVIPISRGGPDHPCNMVVSCSPCNRRKGSSLPDDTPHAWTHRHRRARREWGPLGTHLRNTARRVHLLRHGVRRALSLKAIAGL